MTPSIIGWLHRKVHLRPFVGTLCILVGAFAVALPINMLLEQVSPSRVFLVAVLISGVTYGLWPSLFASLIAVLIYDFFFLPPLYSLSLGSAGDVINLCLFGVTAVIVSTLTARVRRYAIAADKRALSAEKLAAFNRRVSDTVTLQDTLMTAAEQISTSLQRPVALVLSEAGEACARSCYPASAIPDDTCLRALTNWWSTAASSIDDDRFACGEWEFFPLRTSDGTHAAVGIQALLSRHHFDAALSDPLLDAFIEQTALAIERIMIRERLEGARLHAEAGRLRSALLASVSHDLRNPLASIVSSASGLDLQWRMLDDEAKLTLLRTIRTEAERLDAFISNLLDITRIEAGIVRPHRELLYLSDMLGAALDQAPRLIVGHRLSIDLPADLPLIEADAGLLQQVLYNVIENAAKYSQPDSLIRVIANTLGGAVQLSILDEGPGIPEAELELVFEKFYRARNVVHWSGTGLGLAICRGFLEAMHGTIEVANRDDRPGTIVAVTLPIASQQVFRELEIS